MKLSDRRKSFNMTQQEVADALGVQRSAVAMWESGYAPRAYIIPKMAALYKCTADDLLAGMSLPDIGHKPTRKEATH